MYRLKYFTCKHVWRFDRFTIFPYFICLTGYICIGMCDDRAGGLRRPSPLPEPGFFVLSIISYIFSSHIPIFIILYIQSFQNIFWMIRVMRVWPQRLLEVIWDHIDVTYIRLPISRELLIIDECSLYQIKATFMIFILV